MIGISTPILCPAQIGVSTIRVSEWDKEATIVVQGSSLTHPLTRMVLTPTRMVLTPTRMVLSSDADGTVPRTPQLQHNSNLRHLKPSRDRANLLFVTAPLNHLSEVTKCQLQ